MGQISEFGKILILIGVVLILAGMLFSFVDRIPHIGRLPGDIYIQKKNFTFYFPITTSILISIILSFILWLWLRR